MKVKFLIMFSLGAALLMVCAPLFGHHGTGVSYDNSKAYMVKATVTEFRYANPHPQLFFDVKDDKGERGALERRNCSEPGPVGASRLGQEAFRGRPWPRGLK